MIRVAIADDSPFTCRLLASYVEAGGDCEVVGMAHDAPSTLALVQRARPDVLTLDLGMPGGQGLDLLQTIAPSTSVVVISGITRRAAATTLRALELGAIDFVLKCTPGAPSSPASLRREIVAKVTAAASARRAEPPRAAATGADRSSGETCRRAARASAVSAVRARMAGDDRAVVVIGASTGGPAALAALLAELPADFDTPCVVVQHLPAGFTAAFAAQLGRVARMPVREADAGVRLAPGELLVTPGGRHLVVGRGGRIEVRAPGADDLYRPSIDAAMASAADAYGPGAVGVVLSGMGDDGAEGLARIRSGGGRAYVQTPDTCVMASMPSRALARAGADFVGAPHELGALLANRRPR